LPQENFLGDVTASLASSTPTANSYARYCTGSDIAFAVLLSQNYNFIVD